MREDESVYYTDGACSEPMGVGGWAYIEIVPRNDDIDIFVKNGGKKETTNNEMELTAVYMALVKAYKRKRKKVTICCDSAYVVNAIIKGWLKNWCVNGWKTKEEKPIKNKHIWEKMYILLYKKGMIVNMIKVKGHSGDILNEMADMYAVKAKQSIM